MSQEPIQLDAHRGLGSRALRAMSALMGRTGFASRFGFSHDGLRNYFAVLGYPEPGKLTPADYRSLVERGGIAARVNDAYPEATWSVGFEIRENDEPREGREPTRFERAWDELVSSRRILHYLNRVDIMAGLGRYAVLVLGFDDGKALEEPVAAQDAGRQLLWLTPYYEDQAEIKEWVEDTQDPAFGRPKLYEVSVRRDGSTQITRNRVHRSRVLHVAERITHNEYHGTPRLERVYNRLVDLELKIVGGTGEMFWRSAWQGVHYDLDAELADLTDPQREELKTALEEYVHQLRRFIFTRGVTPHFPQVESVDPSGAFQANVAIISGATGIPQRILLGSERGQLASGQDRDNWLERVGERQESYATPLVEQFVDKIVFAGVLPTPEDDWTTYWPDPTTLSDSAQAEVRQRDSIAIDNLAKQNDVHPTEWRPWFGLAAELPEELREDEPPPTPPVAGPPGAPPSDPEPEEPDDEST